MNEEPTTLEAWSASMAGATAEALSVEIRRLRMDWILERRLNGYQGRKCKFDFSKVDWSLPIKEIAKQMGCSTALVGARRREQGLFQYRQGNIDWSNTDWSLTDAELALEKHCSRWAAGLARRRLAPDTHTNGKAKNAAKRREFWIKCKLDWLLGDAQLARQTGYSRNTISNWRKHLGMPPTHYHQKKRARWEALDWTLSNKELVRQTGVLPSYISMWRHKLGKPRSPYFTRGKAK